MDSVDRFLQLVASAGQEPAPQVDISAAVLRSLRMHEPQPAAADYAPLAVSACLAIAASLFLLLSWQSSVPVDTSVAELVNPISMLIP